MEFVAIKPGQSAFTLIPLGPSSLAIDLVNVVTAPLDEAYNEEPPPPPSLEA